jgi:hypothetical protein
MRAKYVMTVSCVVISAVILVWGGWSVWGLFLLEWCPGSGCGDYLVSIGAIVFGTAAIAGLAAAAWCVRFYPEISHRSPLALGAGSAAVLLPLLFATGDLRRALAADYFPYVIWFRFGHSGIFLVWAVLSLLGCATVVSIARRGSNLTTRSSGP